MRDRPVQSSQAVPSDAQVPQIGEIVAGKYRVESILGAGGMGVVLGARHTGLGQAVAIKFLVVQDEEYRLEASERLLREARAAAQLRGENVVRVYDVGELDNGTPFIVMERLEGRDLAFISEQTKILPIPIAVGLVLQAARAVAEAHAAGIVHRDLKPSNLFVVRQPDGKAQLKVVDFGISKSVSPEHHARTLTGARMALGSPHYMSPEQVRDARAVDSRTDVWSLGVILYELVAGRPAFQADTYPGIFAAIAADSPPPLSELRPEVALGLEQAVERCLLRNPDLRYQRVHEFIRELEPYAARDIVYDELIPSLPHTLPPPPLRPTETAAVVDAEPPSAPRVHTHTQVSADVATPRPPERVEIKSGHRTRDGHGTQLSAAPSAPASAEPAARGWRFAWALAPLAVIALGYALWPRQPASSSISNSLAATELSVETEPPGARVLEGAHTHGFTPLRLTLPAPASAKPRTLILMLEGYAPRAFELEPGRASVSVHFDLVPEHLQPAASAKSGDGAAAVPPVPSAARPSEGTASSARVPVRTAPQPSTSPDIRLVR